MRWLLLFLLLLPGLACAEMFDPNSTQRLQQALQQLGYPVVSLDGQWRTDSADAVRRYRHDFGLPDGTELNVAEATEALNRAQMLGAPPALVWGKNANEFVPNTMMIWNSAIYVPGSLLFASARHSLAMEMLARARPYNGQDSLNAEFSGWSDEERTRAKKWLEDDIRRIGEAGHDKGLLGKTLVEIDLRLAYLGQSQTAADMDREIYPRLALLVDRFPKAQLPAEINRGLSERLLSALGQALNVSSCDKRHRLDQKWAGLGVEILRRFEAVHPGAPELFGFAKVLAQCADPATSTGLLTWRVSEAQRRNLADLAVSAEIDKLQDAIDRGQGAAVKADFLQLYARVSATQRQSPDLMSLASQLDVKEIVGPHLIAQIDALKGRTIEDRMGMTALMDLTASLLRMGFGFDVVDRVFLETDTFWRRDGDILDYYALVTRSMINGGDGKAAVLPLENLVARALAAGDVEAAETFRAQQITALLDLGQFTEAEDRIGSFAAFARQGAQDPRVAAWQARLNLASDEGRPPGIVHAEEMSAYVDAICRPESTAVDEPVVDRKSVYEDPEFLPATRRLHLSERIAQCRGSPYLAATLTRLGCYLWTREGNLSQLTTAMQKWLTDVRKDGTLGDSLVFEKEYMSCPMGIAEAGRHDLLARFIRQIDNGSTDWGVVLLKLATLQNDDYARWVLDRFGGRDSGHISVLFPAMEAATQLDDPRAVAMRQEGHGAFILAHAGASADTAEDAAMRVFALDVAAGYMALNLDGIAQYFLEAAAPDVDKAPAADQVDLLLADAESSRFTLAMGRLALKRGDSSTALAYSHPVVDAFVQRARGGAGGSIEDLGPWAKRLRGFAELYLEALAADASRLAAEPPEKVLAAQQLLAAASASATSGRLAARLSATDPTLVRAYQDALKDLRGTMMSAAQGGEATTLAGKRTRVSDLRQMIAQRDPGFGANASLSIATVDDIRRRAEGRAIVVLTSLPEHLLVSTVTERHMVSHALPLPRTRIVSAIDAFRATILAEKDVVTAESALLSSAVLSGLGGLSERPGGITFVVDGPFVTLPFSALPILVGQTQNYLGAEIAVSITPSLALLAVRKGAEAGPGRKPFLGIGDAQFAEANALRRLGFVPAALRETSAELRFMGALLGADIRTDLLLGAAATEKRLEEMSSRGDLARYRTIAFATHGFIGKQGKLQEAGLLLSEPPADDSLSDGVLGASEIYKLNLDADLVILSACDTGAVAGGGEGLSDLAQAFTYAGARGLIVTHWAIDTHAATELSKRLATEMRDTPAQKPADAFRNVLRLLLHDPAASRFHHPKYWASHAVVGL